MADRKPSKPREPKKSEAGKGKDREPPAKDTNVDSCDVPKSTHDRAG